MAEKDPTPATTTDDHRAPVSLQRSVDDSHRRGCRFTVSPIVQVHPDADRDDVIGLAASRLESARELLDVLLEHGSDEVRRATILLLGPLEEVSALLGAANDERRWA